MGENQLGDISNAVCINRCGHWLADNSVWGTMDAVLIPNGVFDVYLHEYANPPPKLQWSWAYDTPFDVFGFTSKSHRYVDFTSSSWSVSFKFSLDSHVRNTFYESLNRYVLPLSCSMVFKTTRICIVAGGPWAFIAIYWGWLWRQSKKKGLLTSSSFVNHGVNSPKKHRSTAQWSTKSPHRLVWHEW